MATNEFPYPVPEYGAEAYWAACNERRLVMQRCRACGRYRWQPAPICPDCQAAAHEWSTLSGRGRIYSWTVIAHPVHPAAVARVPYVVVEVELDEQPGLRLIANLVDGAAADIAIDAPVEVCFEQHRNGQWLPMFRFRSTSSP
ncbi:MAG: Zn-ribbon domain-containing OB-fold protein [Gammaproteobacteria bacterium]